MNRKLTTAIALALILTLSLAVTAMAQGNGPGNGMNGQCPQGEFVDADGDGVCDNASEADAGMQRQRGSSNRGNAAAGNTGNGLNFADADGDKICDNFVDVDGDGVSDNQVGLGRGRRGNSARGQQGGNMQGRQHGFGQHANQ